MKEDLFSESLVQRERTAAEYTVFSDGSPLPPRWRTQWEELLDGRDPKNGKSWPTKLRELCEEKNWPQHAFGTANAGVLVLWNRPRTVETTHTNETPHWTEPRPPVLGGIPHTQIIGWSPGPAGVGWIPSWQKLRKYLRIAIEPFGLAHPMSAVAVASLNPTFGVTGESDRQANIRALQSQGPIDHIVSTVRPLLTLACGGPVRLAVKKSGWKPAYGAMCLVDHPSTWEGYGSGRRDGDRIVQLFAEWVKTGCIPK